VYIWDREAPITVANAPVNAKLGSTLSTPHSISPSTFALNDETRASPAYYPPRSMGIKAQSTTGVAPTTIRPQKALEGHGDGAVFEVKWASEGILISAGEDGYVGIWGTNKEEDETEDEDTAS
jgi:COMPASS component SWD3